MSEYTQDDLDQSYEDGLQEGWGEGYEECREKAINKLDHYFGGDGKIFTELKEIMENM